MNATVRQNGISLDSWGGQYWQQSRRPLASLAFILPLLALYEGGIVVLGTSSVRNGADVWLRQLLDQIGLGSYFLLPVLTIALLVAWHHTTRQPWKLSAGVLYGMLVESALLGLLLLVLAQLQASALQTMLSPAAPAAAEVEAELRRDAGGMLALLLGFFGAGVYEEVLFRLMLLPVVMGILAWLGASRLWQIVGAIVVTSVAFSLAHYVGPQGDAWQWFTFLFRFLAGGFFALVFVHRGFGIAAGAHALYDVFVGMRM